MTFPAGGGRGAALDAAAGADGGFEFVAGSGVGAEEETAEGGLDHPPVLGCDVTVSLVVTSRGCGALVCRTAFSVASYVIAELNYML